MLSSQDRLALVVVTCVAGVAFTRGCGDDTWTPPTPDAGPIVDAAPDVDDGCPPAEYRCCAPGEEPVDPVCDPDGDQHCEDGQEVCE